MHLVQSDNDGKLAKLVLMLSSNADGEVVAAAKAIDRTLKASGCDWHYLARVLSSPDQCTKPPESDWHSVALGLLSRGGFNPRERDFLRNMARCASPSQKQKAWLTDLYARHGA